MGRTLRNVHVLPVRHVENFTALQRAAGQRGVSDGVLGCFKFYGTVGILGGIARLLIPEYE